MENKTAYNPEHRLKKSEEWRRLQSTIQQAKKDRRPSQEEMATFEAALGNKVLNWDEIMVQSTGNPGWPRMRQIIKLKCECGREETKLMTPKILQSPTRSLCKSCGSSIRDFVTDHLKDPVIKAKAKATFAAAVRGVGTPENDGVRKEIEAALGSSVTNWESLAFTRYGAPSRQPSRQELFFVCQECHRPNSFTFTMVDEVPVRCSSCAACHAMEKRGAKRSKGEIEVEEYLISLGEKVVPSLFSIAPGFEVDLYLPDHDLGIEYNGLYWHNEDRRDRNYHLEKLNAATKNGKRLIQIFEDEWVSNQQVVKNRLAHILNHGAKLAGGRQCEIKDPLPGQVRELLESHHLQGACIYQVAKGAYLNGTLVAVMTFSRPRMFIGRSEHGDSEWELVRFVSSGSIPGIASRLLRAFRKDCPQDAIISYADLRWSDGGLYDSLGFTKIKQSPPNYWYIRGGNRYHRSGFAKYKLVEQGFDETMTEDEIMRERGYLRIWDCGTLVYRLDPAPCLQTNAT